ALGGRRRGRRGHAARTAPAVRALARAHAELMLVSDHAGTALSAAAVMARARTENFPVASRLLPRRARSHLLAVYGFARLADELGDAAAGDRLAALDELERELDLAFQSRAQHPLLVRLQTTLSECELERGPFARL